MDIVSPGISLFLLSSLFIGFLIVLPIYCIIDVMRHDFKGNDKLIWVLIIILTPPLGMFLYLLIGSKSKLRRI